MSNEENAPAADEETARHEQELHPKVRDRLKKLHERLSHVDWARLVAAARKYGPAALDVLEMIHGGG